MIDNNNIELRITPDSGLCSALTRVLTGVNKKAKCQVVDGVLQCKYCSRMNVAIAFDRLLETEEWQQFKSDDKPVAECYENNVFVAKLYSGPNRWKEYCKWRRQASEALAGIPVGVLAEDLLMAGAKKVR